MKNAVLQILETWLSKERLLSNSTPRFLTDDEESTEQPSSVRPGVSNPAPGELPSYRFQLQPQSNTPEPANQVLQGYLLISDRCVTAGLELKSAGW